MWHRRTPRLEIRPFYLHRAVDASGISGKGRVAVGVLMPSGKAVLEWGSRWKTVTVFQSIDQVIRIHGHGGDTVFVWGYLPGRAEATVGTEGSSDRALAQFFRKKWQGFSLSVRGATEEMPKLSSVLRPRAPDPGQTPRPPSPLPALPAKWWAGQEKGGADRQMPLSQIRE